MDPTSRQKAGLAVTERIAALGTSPDAVARAAGTSGATIRAVMRGSRWPHLTTRSRIELALAWEVGEMERRADGIENPSFLGDFEDTALLVELLRRHQERERVAGR